MIRFHMIVLTHESNDHTLFKAKVLKLLEQCWRRWGVFRRWWCSIGWWTSSSCPTSEREIRPERERRALRNVGFAFYAFKLPNLNTKNIQLIWVNRVLWFSLTVWILSIRFKMKLNYRCCFIHYIAYSAKWDPT